MSLDSWPIFLSHYLQHHDKPLMIVTVIETKGSTPREVGAKMIVSQNELLYGTIGGGQLEFKAMEMAQKFLQQKAEIISHSFALGPHMNQCCGGMMELLFEPIYPQKKLYIFGGGHVAAELIYLIQPFHFNVVVIDDRAEIISHLKNRFPHLVVFNFSSWKNHLIEMEMNHKHSAPYYLIMTHSHDLDFEILLGLVQSSHTKNYIGLIGSASKWTNFKKKLVTNEVHEELISTIECPIGTKTENKSPPMVALNILNRLLQLTEVD
jgi:xanthine dehydrogenase accessory factor